IAAQVADTAAAGEVLVSNTVKDLVAGSGIRFEDRGVHGFENIPGQWHLFAVSRGGAHHFSRQDTQAGTFLLPVPEATAKKLVEATRPGQVADSGQRLSRAASGTSRRTSKRAIASLAVLPLVNTGSDPSLDYLSDGVTEAIINALSQFPKLRVVARSSVFRYKDRQADPCEVGRLLGAQAVLTGRVRQVEDRLIVSTELIDVNNDSQLWGETYNRKLSDIFEVQEEIAREITDKLRLKLTRKQKTRLARRHTVNVEAYQAYLKGRYHWNKRTTESLHRGIEYFRQAIDMDPG